MEQTTPQYKTEGRGRTTAERLREQQMTGKNHQRIAN